MDSKTPFELERSEKNDVWESSNPRFLSHISVSVAYGQLAVRSSLILSGGALFALPAYFSALGGKAELNAEFTIASAGCFVLGVVLAALCSYLTYLNFQNYAFVEEWERLKQFSLIEESYDNVYKHRMKEGREAYRESTGMKELYPARGFGLRYVALAPIFCSLWDAFSQDMRYCGGKMSLKMQSSPSRVITGLVYTAGQSKPEPSR